jgi:phosphatidylglycerophosphatase A
MTISMSDVKFQLKNPVHLLALGLGSGLLKPAPGTWGTLAAVPFYLLLATLPLWMYATFVVIAFVLGVYICGKTASDIGSHDHGSIVWDEFVGLWISLMFLPREHSLYWLLLGFVFFRFFDIVKPSPISLLDRKVRGGFGIMIDDAIAGLYAMACLLISTEIFHYYTTA